MEPENGFVVNSHDRILKGPPLDRAPSSPLILPKGHVEKERRIIKRQERERQERERGKRGREGERGENGQE